MSIAWTPPVNAARTELGDAAFRRLKTTTKLIRSRSQLVKSQPQSSQPADDVDPVVVPIYQTAVYRNRSVQQYLDILKTRGYVYQNWGNPTTEAVETVVNELEDGAGSILFSSGLAAVNAVFQAFLQSGDHLIYPNPCYTGTVQLIKIMEKFGIETDTVLAGESVEEYRKKIKANTRIVYTESPNNPNMIITDLKAFGALGKNNPQIITVVDGTFASPYLQQPLKFGVNISVHSCSKYLGGHTDLLAGAATVNNLHLWKQLKVLSTTTGAVLGPFDSYLLYRGLRTVTLRVERQCKNAMAIAKFLQSHPKVIKVWYPGLPSHPQHEIAKRQMVDFGGIISFEVSSMEQAKRLVEGVKVINLASSLGGVESLIEHPASMTHNKELLKENGEDDSLVMDVSDGLVRMSVGVEDEQDLIHDLKQALDKC